MNLRSRLVDTVKIRHSIKYYTENLRFWEVWIEAWLAFEAYLVLACMRGSEDGIFEKVYMILVRGVIF